MTELKIDSTKSAVNLPALTGLLGNSLILGLWIWLYAPLYPYLRTIFSRQDFLTNQLILVGIAGLLIYRLKDSHFQANTLASQPTLRRFPLFLTIGGSIVYLLSERFIDANILSATSFYLASYGLIGLWMPQNAWRRGLTAALLLIGTLPFGHQIQTFVGYPMRLLTASLVRDGLATAGIGSLGVDTILIFENGISHVDIPCSGVRSLWTGSLFLLAATWLEERPISLRWLLIALILWVALFFANLTRVALLVITGQVMGWTLFADLIHIPLGVLGFVAACGLALWLLRNWLKPQPQSETNPSTQTPSPKLAVFLPIMLTIMALSYTSTVRDAGLQAPPAWQFGELTTEPLPLTTEQLEWLTLDGAESADRRTFQLNDTTGTLLLIPSTNWHAHHNPERCFAGSGLRTQEAKTHLVDDDFPVRLLSLGSGEREQTAVYWFQSTEQTTDDYATRIWDDITLKRNRWVLVAVLFDGKIDPNSPDFQTLTHTLHTTTHAFLKES